jgi:hypothetical protein
VVCSISFLLCCPISQIPLQRNLLRYRKTLPNGDWKLLRTPADICMVRSIVLLLLGLSLILPASQLSLFVYDLLSAMSSVLNIRWAHDGIVTAGPYCTAQGVIKQIGGTGVALITLVCIMYRFSVHSCTTYLPDTRHSYIHDGSLESRRRSASLYIQHRCPHMAFPCSLGQYR